MSIFNKKSVKELKVEIFRLFHLYKKEKYSFNIIQRGIEFLEIKVLGVDTPEGERSSGKSYIVSLSLRRPLVKTDLRGLNLTVATRLGYTLLCLQKNL